MGWLQRMLDWIDPVEKQGYFAKVYIRVAPYNAPSDFLPLSR